MKLTNLSVSQEEIASFQDKYLFFDTKKFKIDISEKIKKMMELPLPNSEGDCYNFSVMYTNSREPGLLQAIITDEGYYIMFYESENHKKCIEKKCEKSFFVEKFIFVFDKLFKNGFVPINYEYCHSF